MSARSRRRRPSPRPRAAAAGGSLLALALASCGGADGPLEVPIANLREKPDVYVGDEISVVGEVAKGPAAGRYVLRDDDGEVIFVEPPSLVSRKVGEQVTAEGIFVIDLGGRPLLNVEAVDPAEGD